MATSDVRPNRRGIKSREAVLDAAERVMAEHGYEAATATQIVKECGIPVSSVYHYFGNKQGILLAVMERGARRFFDSIPDIDPNQIDVSADPRRTLELLVAGLTAALKAHPDFLRLVVVMATQPAPAEEAAAAQDVVGRVREEALVRLRRLLAATFGVKTNSRVADRLARFALAVIDGSFVATQADDIRLDRLLEHLPAALVAIHVELATKK